MKKLTLFIALAITAITLSSNVYAYLPPAAVLDPLYANITTDVNELSTRAWPIVFLITGITIAIGLFKKFTKKAAG